MRKIKLFLSLLMVMLLSEGNVWADSPATITFGDLNLTNQQQYTDPFDIDANVSITFAGGNNDGKYYTTGSGIRTYGGGTITIETSSGTITKAEFTWSGSSYAPASNDVADAGAYSTTNSTWTGNAASFTLTRPSGSGHWRLQSVAVTYSGGSNNPTV